MTVQELMDKLSAFPADAEVRMYRFVTDEGLEYRRNGDGYALWDDITEVINDCGIINIM